MKALLNKLLKGEDLTLEEAKRGAELLLSGQATDAQIAAFLIALRMKGETVDEIVGLTSVLSDKAVHIHPQNQEYVDIVGTGGDGTNTFNISTTSAFVIAGAGLAVAKHGNRAISSKSGAGDVLEALGVNIVAEPAQVEKAIDEIGIGFMFAQTFNPAMRFVGKVRTEMGVRTVFNILGPMANPSGAKFQMIGVYDPELTEKIAEVMLKLGVVKQGMVFSDARGMDELSTVADTKISEIRDGKVTTYTITPEQFGLKRAQPEDILGGTCEENAAYTKAVLSGEKGPKRDIVLLNAGMSLYAGGLAETPEAGIALAAETIDSGKALAKLEALVAFTQK